MPNTKRSSPNFVDTERVFDGATYTYEDDRFHYAEQRFVTLGLRTAGSETGIGEDLNIASGGRGRSGVVQISRPGVPDQDERCTSCIQGCFRLTIASTRAYAIFMAHAGDADVSLQACLPHAAQQQPMPTRP